MFLKAQNTRSLISLVILWIALSFSVAAKAFEPEVFIQPQEGSVLDIFELTIRLQGDIPEKILTPEFAKSDNFEIVYTGSGSQMSYVNGRASMSRDFSFQVIPNRKLKPGRYKIPPGSISLNDKKVPLKQAIIKIRKTDDLKNSNNTLSGAKFTHDVNNGEPYIGEQIVHTTSLYLPERIKDIKAEPAEYDGFWSESFGNNSSKTLNAGYSGDRTYNERIALFPLSTEKLRIRERVLEAAVLAPNSPKQRQLGSIFDDPWFARRRRSFQKETYSLGEISVNPKPLPPHPKKFKGYIPVGKVNVKTKFNYSEAAIGDSLELTIYLSGDANLRPLKLPEAIGKDSDKFKIYPKSDTVNVNTHGEFVLMRKIFTLELVPQVAGNIQIPVFAFETFNPKSKTYSTIQSNSALIQIKPSASGQTSLLSKAPTNPFPKNSAIDDSLLTQTADDNSPLKDLVKPSSLVLPKLPTEPKFWWGFIFLIPTLYSCLLGLKKFLIARRKDNSKKLLARTQQSVKSDDLGKIDQSLRAYLQKQLGCGTSIRSIRDSLGQILGDEAETCNEELSEILRFLEDQRFSAKKTTTDPKEIRSRTLVFINKLHKKLPTWKD